MKKLVAILGVVFTAGCSTLGASEKLLIVTGGVDESIFSRGCEIQLFRGNSPELKDYDRREVISNAYEFDYLVSPTGGKHRLELVCAGKSVSSKTFTISRFKAKTQIQMGLTVEIHT